MAVVFEVSAVVLDVELDVAMLVEECAVMDYCVFSAVANRHQVQRAILVLNEQLNVL